MSELTGHPAPVDLDALDRLHQAATPGEWVHEKHRYDGAVHLHTAENRYPLADFGRFEDVGLVVALHNAYPALAAELRALRAAGSEGGTA